jgi:hypothetical protein
VIKHLLFAKKKWNTLQVITLKNKRYCKIRNTLLDVKNSPIDTETLFGKYTKIVD